MGEHADDALDRAMDVEENEYRHSQAWADGPRPIITNKEEQT